MNAVARVTGLSRPGSVILGGADGIEVRIFDDMEDLVGQYFINAGKWHCEIDRLADLNS
jgi:hypothetical protein